MKYTAVILYVTHWYNNKDDNNYSILVTTVVEIYMYPTK